MSHTLVRVPTRYVCSAVLLACACCHALESPPVRIKDIATVAGTTGEAVMGYGLVVGLEGTGDTARSVVTAQAMANMLQHFDLKVEPKDLATANMAAVLVTGTLPASGQPGDRFDVTVASMGDASSLYGAVLLPTPLRGNATDILGIAEGSVSIGGINAASGGQKVSRNHPVTARVVNGGSVMKAPGPKATADRVSLTLRQPDFTTALRVSEAINEHLKSQAARAVAPQTVEIAVPEAQRGDVVAFVAQIESLTVVGDAAARIVVNERTGTIIIGGDVRILPVAVAHGSLTITVTRRLEVSQPPPFSGGTTVVRESAPPAANEPEQQAGTAQPGAGEEAAPLPGARTVVTPRTDLDVNEEDASLVELQPQTRLGDLVDALNTLGVKPRDLIAILQALKAANALQAELVLM